MAEPDEHTKPTESAGAAGSAEPGETARTSRAPQTSCAPRPRPARVPKRAAPRRAAILETARRLFAEHGIDAVTTNRIAEVAGISPGNLYYWFASKEEVVRALFEDWSRQMRIPSDETDTPEDALRMIWTRAARTRQPDPRYAFFLRDLFPLLHADPLLAEAYRHGYTSRRDEFVRVIDGLIDADLLRRPEPPTTVGELVGLLWLVSETAQPFADVVGDATVDPRRYGRALMQPLLTDAGRRALDLPVPHSRQEELA